MATSRVYFSKKAANPSPLMLVNGKGKGQVGLAPAKATNANKAKPRRRASNPSVTGLIGQGVAAGIGSLLTEFGVNFIASFPFLQGFLGNRFIKALTKMAFGVALAFGAEKISFTKNYAGALGAGGIAAGFAELARMAGVKKKMDFYMPVQMQHHHAKAQAIAQGAETPQQVAVKAKEGDKAAQAALAGLADYDEEDLQDLVMIPMQYGAGGGLQDLVVLNRGYGWAT